MILKRLQAGAYLLIGMHPPNMGVCRYGPTEGLRHCAYLFHIVVRAAVEGGAGVDQTYRLCGHPLGPWRVGKFWGTGFQLLHLL